MSSITSTVSASQVQGGMVIGTALFLGIESADKVARVVGVELPSRVKLALSFLGAVALPLLARRVIGGEGGALAAQVTAWGFSQIIHGALEKRECKD